MCYSRGNNLQTAKLTNNLELEKTACGHSYPELPFPLQLGRGFSNGSWTLSWILLGTLGPRPDLSLILERSPMMINSSRVWPHCCFMPRNPGPPMEASLFSSQTSQPQLTHELYR